MMRSRLEHLKVVPGVKDELSVMTSRSPAIAVTGASGVLGEQLVRLLSGEPGSGEVVAIDSTATRSSVRTAPPPAPPGAGVSWRTADVRDSGFARALEGVDVVVHTAFDQRPDAPAAERRACNVEGASNVLAAAAAAGVRAVVVVSSAMVYGALPDNPALLTERDRVRAVADDSVVGDLVEVEARIERFREQHPQMAIAVLRPVTVVGPGCDTVLTRHFESPRLLTIRGVAPRWQFVHVDDLAAACAVAARSALDGVFNVTPPGVLSQGDVESITGVRRIELPASLVFGAADRLHRAGVTLAPAGELHFVAYPWSVDASRLIAAGWSPVHDNASALRAHVHAVREASPSARRRGRDDATRAAAGATVAVLGTAALLRRARRRRR
jgi:nucleoside-diphosphate-sugar epimerase